MSAAITDKFKKGYGFFSTTLSAQKNSGASSMSLSDATGVPTTTGLVFTVGRVNSSGTLTPSTRAIYKGTLSGTTVSNLTLTEGTDQTHAAGTVVEITFTATHWNDVIDGIVAEHNQDGTHAAITATSANVSGTVTTDTIAERTSANGVTIDGLNIKDSKLVTSDSVVTANITDAAVTPAKRSGGFKVGTIAPTGNGQASVTGVGFQPKFIEMHLIPGTSGSVAKMCHGFSDGTTTFSAGFQAVESGDISRIQSTALLCFNPTTNSVAVDEITLDSFDSDGFTYTKADHNGTETFRYICFG